MIALLLLLAAPAEAADLYLAGGWSAAPSEVLQPATGVPAWRLGVAFGRTTIWGSGRYARFALPEDDVRGNAWQPQLGLRVDLADRTDGGVTGALVGSVFTVGAGFEAGGEEHELDTSLRRNLGGTVGFALDAVIHEHLSISPEIGLQGFTVSVIEADTYVTAVNEASTYAAVFVNLWL